MATPLFLQLQLDINEAFGGDLSKQVQAVVTGWIYFTSPKKLYQKGQHLYTIPRATSVYFINVESKGASFFPIAVWI